MDSVPTLYPVLPQSVYVWRGFKNPAKSYDEFAGFLGSVFVPACALLQPKVGLRAYIPTLVPQAGKPQSIPDQTALMFWASPVSHDLANETVAVRAYQHLHGQLYDMTRSHHQEVPIALPSQAQYLVDEQPYYLSDSEVDWMYGSVLHTIASRSPTTDPATFRARVFEWATSLTKTFGHVIDAALMVVNEDSFLSWLHSTSGKIDPMSLNSIEPMINIHLQLEPRQTGLKHGLWNNWSGINYSDPQNCSINIQFERTEHTDPI